MLVDVGYCDIEPGIAAYKYLHKNYSMTAFPVQLQIYFVGLNQRFGQPRADKNILFPLSVNNGKIIYIINAMMILTTIMKPNGG